MRSLSFAPHHLPSVCVPVGKQVFITTARGRSGSQVTRVSHRRHSPVVVMTSNSIHARFTPV